MIYKLIFLLKKIAVLLRSSALREKPALPNNVMELLNELLLSRHTHVPSSYEYGLERTTRTSPFSSSAATSLPIRNICALVVCKRCADATCAPVRKSYALMKKP